MTIPSERENRLVLSKNLKKTPSADWTVKLKLSWKTVIPPPSEPVSSSARALPGSAIPEKIKIVMPFNPEKFLSRLPADQKNNSNTFLTNH
jgi:hypothetical protein